MTSSAAPRTIVVVGTSGNQGSGVVRALLSFKATGDKLWLVRGITRDPNSEKARKFLADHQTTGNRLTLVAGNVYDQASLQDAFADAYGVFAIMSEYYPGRLLMNREDMQHEVEAGYNIILAAEKCGIEHFVFSSLPDMVKTTGGRFPNIHHMNNKHAIEKFARERLNTLTFLIPGFFYTNLMRPQYCQRRADGVVGFLTPIPGGQVMQWTDPTYDMGFFAASRLIYAIHTNVHSKDSDGKWLTILLCRGGVFNIGPEKTRGKTLVLSRPITADEMARAFSRVTGQPAIHDPISAEEFAEFAVPVVGPAFKEDAKEMMEWAAVMPAHKICYGAFDSDQSEAVEMLGLKATSFED